MPICKEEESKSRDNSVDPVLTKTCVSGNFKFISIGSSDYKGRYYYAYQVYRTTSGQSVKVENDIFFKDNSEELFGLINGEIKPNMMK